MAIPHRTARSRRLRTAAFLGPTLLLATTACAGQTGGDASTPGTPGTPTEPAATTGSATAREGTLTVFAAASLDDSFEQIGERFETENPGVDVQFNFDGSSGLVEQLSAGAPADVFASADQINMQRAVENGDMGESSEPIAFATNVLTLVTPPDNPADISSLEDVAAEGVNLVVCAPQVPCGNASQTIAEDAGVELNPVSEETSVTDVLGKVVSGQADAGLVYVTDAVAAGDGVNVVELPNADAAVNTYPIGVTAATDQPEPAQDFVDFVVGPEGREVLAEAGFGTP